MLTKLALAGALLCALSAPVAAQEGYCFTMSIVELQLMDQGTPYKIIKDPVLVQKFVDEVAEVVIGKGDIAGVTEVLLANFSGSIEFGLLIDGCLTPATAIPGATALPVKLSGRLPDGQTFA